MPALCNNLSHYAAYHLNSKNIISHLFGIPLIVASIILLLARVELSAADFNFDLAQLAILFSAAYYLSLDRLMGLLLLAVFALQYWLLQPLMDASFTLWLSVSIGLFVLGWLIQFIGHYYERMKPAFFDDIKGLIIGPLFIAAEVLFFLGYKPSLQQQVIHRAQQIRQSMPTR